MKILEVYTKKLRYKRYAENTIQIYEHYLQEFFRDEKITDPYQVSQKQIQLYLENRNYKSTSQQNQIIGALKLFAKYILGKAQVHLDKIERPRKTTRKQPVIPREIISDRISKIKNLKHKAVISIGYGCGLRVSEVINLQWKAIDREQGVILILNSKGDKDRYAPISENMIKLLEDYWREYKTKSYVFTGLDWRPKYSAGSCNALVKKYIGEKYRFHSLRKSFATHLYSAGNDLAKIQDALGHANEKTTRIYVESSIDSIKNLSSLI